MKYCYALGQLLVKFFVKQLWTIRIFLEFDRDVSNTRRRNPFNNCDYISVYYKNWIGIMFNIQSVEKTAFLKLTYLSLQWMTYMSTAQALKCPSLKFIINLLDARKVHLILLHRSLIAFSHFCKRGATYFRL